MMDAALGAAFLGGAFLLRRAGRSWMFPPAAWMAVWGVAFLMIARAGDWFYPLTDEIRVLALVGAGAFALGGGIAAALLFGLPDRPVPTLDRRRIGRLMDGVLVVMVLAIPVYWAEVVAGARGAAIENILLSARVQALGAAEGLAPRMPFLIRNLVQVSLAITFIGVALVDDTPRWRVRVGGLFLLTLAYQLLTGGRAGALILVLGVIGIAVVRARRLPVVPLVGGAAAFAVVFAVIGIQLEKGTARRGAPLRENLPALWVNFEEYAVGGIVALDRVVDDPGSVPSTGGFTRTARQVANVFGADHELPSLHAQYTAIGDFRSTNVYTTYFYYLPDVGYAGTLVLVGLAGFLATVVFWFARRGSLWGLVFFAMVTAAIGQSVFNEAFYGQLNFALKTAVLLAVTYRVGRVPSPAATPGAA